MKYFYFRGKGQETFEADNSYASAYQDKYACQHCRNLYEVNWPHNLDAIVGDYLKKASMSFICHPFFSVSLEVVSFELLDLLGKDISQCLYLGRIYTKSNKIIETHLTYRGKYLLEVRGNKKSTFQICPVCNRKLYFAFGEHYIFKSPDPSIPIFQAPVGLILREDVYDRVKHFKNQFLHVSEIKVLEKTKDNWAHIDLDGH
jgi:hypothetical protein